MTMASAVLDGVEVGPSTGRAAARSVGAGCGPFT